MHFPRHSAFCLAILLLILGHASAARKVKRPVKPAKTFPRTNVTPTPQATTARTTTVSSAAAPALASAKLQADDDVSIEEAPLPSGIFAASDGELPKPLNPPAEAAINAGDSQATEASQISLAKPTAQAAAAAEAMESKTEKPTSASMLPQYGQAMDEDCDPDMIGFEIVTGYVLSAPARMLDTVPGALMLTDCLEACQLNESCSAINYETGLCVLFRTTADKLPGSLSRSQFPVFTIYAQKTCLHVRPCAKAWSIDRVQGHRLADHVRSSLTVYSRRDCFDLCLGETEFTCRSANYYPHSGLCELSEMDRFTLTGTSNIEPYDGVDYLENNCAEEPIKLCEFKRIPGKILKTVDSVYQDVNSMEECQELCLNSPYRCHSYDYNDTGDMVCRLSHHSRATLTDVLDPYLDVPDAATFERGSCYNVSIECRSGEMITKIRTSKLFSGKVYAKGAPKSCASNVNNSLEFNFRMGYNDLECNVRQSAYGRYMNDIVIQHHNMIVTSSDLGLAVSCQYDLTNKTVSNDVDLGVTGEIESSISEEIIIDSPNVIMKITSRDGSDMKRIAEVGDPLALRFEIVEPNSPYEIFVRELVAMDGTDNAEITLIDENGCPTDQYIMGAMRKLSEDRKVLVSQFDAFKFPSSDVVQFRALVTPCIPHCEPVICDNEAANDGYSGESKSSLVSYGRRRRSLTNGTEGSVSISTRHRRDVSDKSTEENILLVQSIHITDKFAFQPESDAKAQSIEKDSNTEYVGVAEESCLNGYGLAVTGAIFLLAQLTIIAVWSTIRERNQNDPYHFGQKF